MLTFLNLFLGISTGSEYIDFSLKLHGFPSEGISNTSVLVVKTHKCMRTHISGVRPYILQLLDSLSILKFAVLMINNKNNCTLETAGHSFVCPFVFFLLVIVLSVLLRYPDSDYPFGIFELFLTITV
jgi:hypothetical protein